METVWFNLMEEGHIKKPFKFVELDLESVVKKKIRKINHSKKLAKLFEKIQLKPQVSGTLKSYQRAPTPVESRRCVYTYSMRSVQYC